MKEMLDRPEKISADKQELLGKLLKQQGKQRTIFPASFAQQRMWVLDQMASSAATYVVPSGLRLIGKLDREALEQAFNEIVARHSVLRTVFVAVGGRPVQVVKPAAAFALPYHDLRQWPRQQREEHLQQLLHQAIYQPFDLARGPLLRLALVQVDQEEHVLLLTTHHIVFDGWSQEVLLQELAQLYEAFVAGEPSPLPALPLQYSDYTHWQHEWMQTSEMQQQQAFWQKELGGPLPTLQLPTDRPRPAVRTAAGAEYPFELAAETARAVRSLSQQQGVTLFMTLQAAFMVLLARYSGQREVLVGSPVANRMRPEVEQLIGCFINTVVLHMDLADNPSVQGLLKRVKQVALEAFAHQEVPFEKLVEALQPERSVSHSPLFQVMFVFQNAPQAPLSLKDLTISHLPVPVQVAEFDLTLYMWETPEGLGGTLKYNTDLFEEATMARLVSHLQRVLQAMAADPQQRVFQIPLLSAAERDQILKHWNQTWTAYPRDNCVHHLFEAQVESDPDAVAVAYGNRSLTYRELNRKANQLAHYLQGLGVGPDVLVALCMERSVEMVIGLLGVLKAGGAYVPLDATLPRERLAFMLEDTQAPVILTLQRTLAQLPSHHTCKLCLDADWPSIATAPATAVTNAARPENLAYVIYTSGSTGEPKGVMIPHRGLVNYLSWCTRAYAIAGGEGSLVHSPLSFDLTVTSLIAPLVVGQRVILLPEDQGLGALTEALSAEQDFSLVKVTPTHLSMLNQSIAAAQVARATRAFIIGGEALLSEHIDFWRMHAPATRLINEYGPTETVVGCCIYEVMPADPPDKATPIGRPIANTRLYILDAYLQPVPVGVVGELYIGGAGLAHGYLKRPQLTAERFIPHPFSDEPGARLYKTGDLASYRADGVIEYWGRRDDQVKIRGYRIELGEIEALISQHPEVQAVVVLAREDVPGDKRLVAYVVSGQDVTESQWRAYLSKRLPEYMIPSIFVRLEALPLTSNGKIDRRQLPVPEKERGGGEYVAPCTPLEEQVAQIWAEVLGLERVGVQDNFFDLGGHSLKATQVMARVRQALGITIPLRTFFEHPTIAGQAGSLEHALKAQEDSDFMAALQPVSRAKGQEKLQAYLEGIPSGEIQAFLATTETNDGNEETYSVSPVSFVQQRMWLIDQIIPDPVAYTIPLGLRLVGRLDREALERAFNEIVARHSVLRTVFVAVGGRPVQVVKPAVRFPLSYHDLRHLPEDRREDQWQRLVRQAIYQPFDLARGPLLRQALIQLADEEQVLLLTIHHIVFDGWSQGVLLRELVQLYEGFVTGQPSSLAPLPLPALPLQYSDYTHWQREWMQAERMQQQLAFWQKQLGGSLPTLQLPADRPLPAVQTASGAEYPFELAAETAQTVKALSKREGVTLFMTLQAAFMMLLARYSGQREVLVGSPVANRMRPEVEQLIGCFINTVVLRLDLSDDPSLGGLLKRVQQVALEAFAHQDVPFEKVVEALQPERSVNHSPFFQVMFVLQNAPQPPLSLKGLETSFLPAFNHTVAGFNLTLCMWETAGGIEGSIEYNTDLFEEATMARLVSHLQRVLQAMVAHPAQRVSQVPLLSPAERAQILRHWNQTHADFPAHRCLHQLIEAQVERTPDALALLFEGQSRTYRELNREANQLAHLLQSAGVGPETLVGVSMERSLELVVVLLAILKAGGAYVPLDPGFPPERLNYLLEDAGVKLVLTQSRFTGRLEHEGVRLMCVDPGWNAGLHGNEENPHSDVGPGNMVYMIYTSGSTGQPKGVINTHRAICNRLTWGQQAYPLSAQDCVLQKTPFTFDVSVPEFFWPLQVGATLCIARPGGHQEPDYLADLIERERITSVHFVPSMLQAFLLEPNLANRCRSLRHVFSSGEALSLELQERFFACFPDAEVQLHNLYGPTEAAIEVSAWTCARQGQAERERGKVPIGRPIANVQLYILDEHMQPVPVGIAGELYIGGVALARGYHRQEELTREKFIADPFGPPGQRLYKTGDLASYRVDGVIEYWGRRDDQVKIRGYRIELGEIEALISQHADVQAVVVLAREDVPGDKRLVAYVVSGQDVTESQWRAYLSKRLPEYMIPSIFVRLETLPLTSSGKVDRRQLPVPEKERGGGEYVAPRTPLEEQVARIWAEVLGLEQVGVQDNFFDLGGHSLLAAQVIARMRAEMQRSLSLGSFFRTQTIAEMASLLREDGQQESRYLVPIKTSGTHPPLFCFHPVGGEVLMYRELASLLTEDVPIYGLQSRVMKGILPEHGSIEEMAYEYATAIRRQQPEGPYYLLGWSMGGAIAVAAAAELEHAGQRVAFVGLLDSYLATAEDLLVQELDTLHGLGPVMEAAIARTPVVISEAEREILQENLLTLPGQEQLPYVLAWGKEHKVLPESLSLDVLRSQVALANTHRTLFNVYQAPIIQAPLAVWWAQEAQVSTRTNWEKYTTGGIQERVVGGNHFTMIGPPYIQVVAQQLADLLRSQ